MSMDILKHVFLKISSAVSAYSFSLLVLHDSLCRLVGMDTGGTHPTNVLD